eukprot:TRINITY_DN14323_c0_g1_i1.p1 TRINITY_DN14323_c0_g1~~TRINITY_DN14323_c0_g1_i1.p1  ORF type:complete len:234 (+),score=55.71 TRINITY_DN14323_c0_g1_i1:76-777(+)
MGNQSLLSEKDAKQRIDKDQWKQLKEIWKLLAGDLKAELDTHKADVLLYIVMKDPDFPRYNTAKLHERAQQIHSDFQGYVEKHQLQYGGKKERWGYVYLKLLDSTSNNALSWREFVGGWGIATSGTLEEKSQACFKLIDFDKDGFLSRDDIYGFLASLKSVNGKLLYDVDDTWTDEMKLQQKELREKLERQVDEIFKEFNTARDGRISQSEYLSLVKKLGFSSELFLFQDPKN